MRDIFWGSKGSRNKVLFFSGPATIKAGPLRKKKDRRRNFLKM